MEKTRETCGRRQGMNEMEHEARMARKRGREMKFNRGVDVAAGRAAHERGFLEEMARRGYQAHRVKDAGGEWFAFLYEDAPGLAYYIRRSRVLEKIAGKREQPGKKQR